MASGEAVWLRFSGFHVAQLTARRGRGKFAGWHATASSFTKQESRAGAMSSDASGECRTTSESFVKKNFSTDVSFSFLKHRSPAEHLKVNEVDQFRDSKFVSDLVRCGRAM